MTTSPPAEVLPERMVAIDPAPPVLVPPATTLREPQRLVSLPHTGPGDALPLAGGMLALGGLGIMVGKRR